ncbi:MAG: glycosyltransferase, partial [Reyranella sp.]|nr:glycosyltransferase [Reyranella sp.]
MGRDAGREHAARPSQPSALCEVLRPGRRRLQPVRPSLDVVVPTLNASPSLARTIAAVRAAENRLDLAITVCDGGSSDDTVAIARRAGA